jgi:hypothetical protein
MVKYDYVREDGRTVSFDIEAEPFFADGSEAAKALDVMVLRAGLRNVIWALVKICDFNAELEAYHGGDPGHAKTWARWATELEALARKKLVAP